MLYGPTTVQSLVAENRTVTIYYDTHAIRGMQNKTVKEDTQCL